MLKYYFLLLLTSVLVFNAKCWAITNLTVNDTTQTTNTTNTIVTPQYQSHVQVAAAKKQGKLARWALRTFARIMPQLPLFTPAESRRANTNAGLGFGMFVGAVFLFPLLAIPGFILSNNALIEERRTPGILTPTNKVLAQIGKWGSLAWLIIIALVIILLFMFLSRWR
jgi:hypothetical protein